jgi:hypothetical protein
MSSLARPDKPLNSALWRFLLVAACVLVFSFAVHAKVAVYGQSQPQPSTSSKLWANGVKFETPVTNSTPSVLWIAIFLAYLMCESQSSRHYVSSVVVREQRLDHYLDRFLRPPPPNSALPLAEN